MSQITVYSTDGPLVYPEPGTPEDGMEELIDRLISLQYFANAYYDGADEYLLHRFKAVPDERMERVNHYYVRIDLQSSNFEGGGLPKLEGTLDELWEHDWQIPEDDSDEAPNHPNRVTELQTLPDIEMDTEAVESLLKEDRTLQWVIPDIRHGYGLVERIIRLNTETSIVISEDVDDLKEVADVLISLGETTSTEPDRRTEKLISKRRRELTEEWIDDKYEEIESELEELKRKYGPSDATFEELCDFLRLLTVLTEYIDPQGMSSQSEIPDEFDDEPFVNTCLEVLDRIHENDTLNESILRSILNDIILRAQRETINTYLNALPDKSDEIEQLKNLKQLKDNFVEEDEKSRFYFLWVHPNPSWAEINVKLSDEVEAYRQAIIARRASEWDEALDTEVTRLADELDLSMNDVRHELLTHSDKIRFSEQLRRAAFRHPLITFVTALLVGASMVGLFTFVSRYVPVLFG